MFLPQRDGFEMAEIDSAAGSEGASEMRRKVFDLDSSEVISADLVLAVLDRRMPDEGVCVEIGIAWATRARDPSRSGRRIVGLKTDARTWLTNDTLNPMVTEALDVLITDEAALLASLTPRRRDGNPSSFASHQ